MSDIIIHCTRDGVNPHRKSEAHHRFFTGHYEWRLFSGTTCVRSSEGLRQAILDLCKGHELTAASWHDAEVHCSATTSAGISGTSDVRRACRDRQILTH